MNIFQKIFLKTKKETDLNESKIQCKAPYSSMYLNVDGKIGVCCYNKIDLLGEYPQTSLKEAWFGKKRKVFVKRMQRNKMSEICEICLDQSESNAFISSIPSTFKNNDINSEYPAEISFECSNNCNLECIMCNNGLSSSIKVQKVENSPHGLKIYDDNLIAELRNFIPHIKSARFIGGEPFLIPLYYKIWDEIIKLNQDCYILITTNGTVLNERIKQLLIRGNFNICVSIESINAINYEKIRVNGNMQKTMENIRYYLDFSKDNRRNFGISTCYIQQNYEDIPELINFCNVNNVYIWFNRVAHPSKCALWNCNKTLLEKVLTFYKTVNFRSDTEVEKSNLKSFNELIELTKIWYNLSIEREIKLPGLELLTTKKLYEILINNIHSYFRNRNGQDELQMVIDKMGRVINSQPNESIRRSQLIYFLNTPVQVIHIYAKCNYLSLLY